MHKRDNTDLSSCVKGSLQQKDLIPGISLAYEKAFRIKGLDDYQG